MRSQPAAKLGAASGLAGLSKPRGLGSNEVLIAITDQRVLVADLSDFRKQGIVERSIANEDVRYVRFRGGDTSGQGELDLITKDDNLTWRFGKGSPSAAPVRTLAALLAERMDIPVAERQALRVGLPSPTDHKQLTE